MGSSPTICIVVPTYNERENIETLIRAVEDASLPGLKMLFVDDASPDGTADIIKRAAETRPWVNLLERKGKRGIGSAYQEGFRAALAETGADILVEMDADLQHPASALTPLVTAVAGGADVAIGSRYAMGGGISGWSRVRRLTSWGANAYARFVLGLEVRDVTSGFRAFTREAARKVSEADLPATGYEFQPAALHFLKGSAVMVEVPYVFLARSAGRSKLRTRDMVRFLFALFRISLFG